MTTQYKQFRVSPKWGAGAPWQDTGMSVTAGQQLAITASGRVSAYTKAIHDKYYPTYPEWFGPDGLNTTLFPCLTGRLDDTKPIMALLGKIGSGPIFRVGRNFAGTANATGTLYLTVNDCNSQALFDDNRGYFKARIVVDPPGVPSCVPCPCGHDETGCQTTSNPIKLYDGTKVLNFTDMELATPAGKLSFERSYNQSKQSDTLFQFMGLGWSHNHIYNLGLGVRWAQIYFPNGGVLRLDDPNATGHFTAQAGSTAVLDASGMDYILTAEDKSQYVFQQNYTGRYLLISRKWASGEQWSYTYINNQLDEVNDGYGRKLKFVYRPTGAFDVGQLWRVGDQTSAATLSNTTPDGRFVELSYSPEKLAGADYGSPVKALLTGFKDVHGKDWSYEYYGKLGSESDPAKRSFLLKRISPQVDTNGDGVDDTLLTLEKLSYTLNGTTITAIDQQRGNGLLDTHLAFEKDPAIGKNQTTESINNLSVGFAKTHFFANGVYLGTGVDDADNSPFDIQVLDGNYRPIGQMDGAGNDTQLQWANSNVTNLPGALLTAVTDAKGNQTLFDYNADDTLKISTDADGRKTLYVYDPNRRVPTLVMVANSAVEVAINGAMEITTGWSAVAGATTGLVTAPVDSGLNSRQVTANVLNAGIETNPAVALKANTTYVISARVRPAAGQVKMQLVNGATVLKSALSDTTPAKMNTWQTLRLVYTTTSAIAASKLQFLANVTSTSFYVDSVHMIETTSLQHWQEIIYDDKLRPLFERVITPATGAVQQETERVYGTTGNDAGLVQQMIQRDPLAVSNNYAYTYTYDSAGRIVTTQKQSVFGSCEFSHTVYDAAGLVLATVCGPTGTTPTSPTAARDMYVTNNQNKVTTYDYDSMGRQVKITSNDGTGSTNKQTTLTVYDALNRVIRTIANYTNPGSYTAPAAWVWDTNARVWKDGNGQTISHGTDPVTGTLNTQNVISITDFNKIGAVRQQTDVLGQVTLYGYDNSGRVVKTIRNASVTDYNNDFAGTSPNVADPDLSDYVVNDAPDQDIVTQTVYDANGNPVKSIDPLGNVAYTVYDALKRPIRTIRNAKDSARIDLYDNDDLYKPGNDPTSPLYMPSMAADQDQIERTEYDAMGRVVRQIDVLGKVTYTAYDAQGRVSKTIRNYVSQVTTNPQNWFWYEDAVPTLRWQRSSSDTTLIDQGAGNDQNIISYTAYDPEGRTLYTQDPLGRRTWIKYDGLGRVVKTIANAAALPTVTLGSASDPRSDSYVPSTQSDKDRISITTYDSQGRLQWTQDSNGRKHWNVYDSQGRVVKTIANCTYVSGSPVPEDPTYVGSSNADDDIISRTEYDIWGRLSKTIDPLGHETRYGYDLLGRRTTAILNYVDGIYDPAFPDVDLIQTTEYDVAGRVVKTTDARGTQTVFTYDQAGRRLTVTQAANSPLASMSYTVYDKGSRVRRSIAGYTPLYQQNGEVVYLPVNNGNFPSTLILPDMQTTKGQWDFVPPHNGEANDRNLITEFLYDQAGRQISSSDPLGNTVQTVYAKDGTVESLIDPEGVVTKYRYDKLNRRTRVVQNYADMSIQPKIVYDSNPSGFRVYTMDPDGTNVFAVTPAGATYVTPSWSPDGSKITYRFTANGGTTGQIYSIKPDGTGAVQLTAVTGYALDPSWSPDGRFIAFRSGTGGGPYTLYIMKADGSNIRQLSTLAVSGMPSWSPDGQHLAFSSSNTLYVIRADGTDLTNTQITGSNPVWSPDGSQIAFDNGTQLFVMDADGTNPLNLSTDRGAGNGTDPFWSPDGSKIAFVSNRSVDLELYVMNADGSNVVRLTNNAFGIWDQEPNWSPQTIDPLFWIWNATSTRWEYGFANPVTHGTDNDQNIIVDVTYDKVGRVLTQREPMGNVMTYAYDLLNRRTSLTNPLSKVWSTTYTDLAGGKTRAATTYPGASYQVKRDFDRMGRLSTIQYGLPANTPDVAMTYDKLGNRVKMSEYSAVNFTTRIRETSFNYDMARRLSSVGFDNNGDGVVDDTVSYQYDAGGLRTKLTMPGNLDVIYTYDQRGQLLSLTNWDNLKSQFAYDNVGRRSVIERPNGFRSRYKYDKAGRLRLLRHTREGYVSTKFPSVITPLDGFGQNGALSSNWSGSTGGYSIVSNNLDVGTGGDIYWTGSTFGSDQEAFITFGSIDAASTENSLLLKAQSNLWSNGIIKIMYKPATGNVQVWTYTASQGWVQRGSDISVTFAFQDTFGARALASGKVQVFKNDVMVGDCDISAWPFNANGGSIGLWMVNASNATFGPFGGSTATSSSSLPVSATHAQFEYQVDKRGNRTQALELLASSSPGTDIINPAYYKELVLSDNWLDVNGYKENSRPNASLKFVFLGDDTTLSMGQGPDHAIYDVYIDGSLWQSFDGYAATASQRDIVISLGVDSRKLQSEGVHLLEIRSRSEKNANATGFKVRFKQATTDSCTRRTITYNYDHLARLKEARSNPGINIAALDAELFERYLYTFDRAGNRLSESIAYNGGLPTVTNYTYNAANQITNSGFAYDNNGNLLSGGTDSQGMAISYIWDRANRIIHTNSGLNFVYDGLGNMVKEGGWSRLLDLQPGSASLLREYSSISNLKNYYLDEPDGLLMRRYGSNVWEWPFHDGLGSERGKVDYRVADSLATTCNYTPFGVSLGIHDTNEGFTGEWHQNTSGDQLVYLRARFYNPQIGIFTSLDPFEGMRDRAMSLNGYSWVEGNPINWIDPTGKQTGVVEGTIAFCSTPIGAPICASVVYFIGQMLAEGYKQNPTVLDTIIQAIAGTCNQASTSINQLSILGPYYGLNVLNDASVSAQQLLAILAYYTGDNSNPLQQDDNTVREVIADWYDFIDYDDPHWKEDKSRCWDDLFNTDEDSIRSGKYDAQIKEIAKKILNNPTKTFSEEGGATRFVAVGQYNNVWLHFRLVFENAILVVKSVLFCSDDECKDPHPCV